MTEEATQTVRMWRVRILTTTWLSYAAFYVCRKNFAIAKSSIMSSMEIGRSDVAHIFTAYLAAYMIGQYMTGFLGRNVAMRMLLLAGMGITFTFGPPPPPSSPPPSPPPLSRPAWQRKHTQPSSVTLDASPRQLRK